ncbi:MAG TPA: MFS transporter [Chloroflexia bacterium]|nr:MFS transporter [Chloroflexia bacterium]
MSQSIERKEEGENLEIDELQLVADSHETGEEKRGVDSSATLHLPTDLAEPSGDDTVLREAEPKGLIPRFMRGITRNVVVLGIVAFFTDVSSEMIVPIRILFLVIVLRTPLPVAGLIEGLAESTASILKIVSGRMSDRVSRRKPLILFGYSVSNAAKPLLALVGAWPSALLLIFVDRVGKGVRGSPRDAMMADSTPKEYMGKAFGFHRSMDTLGAATGPLFTYLILMLTSNDLRAVFAWTALPGILSVLVILLFLRERKPRTEKEAADAVESRAAEAKKESQKVRIPASALGTRFWMFTAISTVFALGNSSDAFIFLRTADLEQSLLLVPLLYFGYNLIYAALATPLGVLSDRWGRLPVLISGYTAFALVYAGWAMATQAWNAWALFLVYGIYAAATEGVAKAFVTDMVPKSARGSAMGWFNGLTGVAALPANLIGGWLWSVAGAGATFTFGAWAAVVAVALTVAWLPWLRKSEKAAPVQLAPEAQMSPVPR